MIKKNERRTQCNGRHRLFRPNVSGLCLTVAVLGVFTGSQELSAQEEAPGLSIAATAQEPAPAVKEQLAQNEEVDFDISAQSLDSALTALADQADLEILFTSSQVAGLEVEGLIGSYTPDAALSRLLEKTNITFRFTGAKTVTLERVADQSLPMRLAPVTVTAAREGGTLDTLSRNVTVITRDDIEQQRATAATTADILGKLVPGMGSSSQTLTNSGQTLRGRDVLVLLDGVPLNTSRNVSRDLFNISPSSIESIEVIHGGSAAYGGGAAGGVIHINTLKAEEGPPTLETTLEASSSLTQFEDEALSGRLEQRLSGKEGNFDYVFAFSGQQTQGFFDADGDRIPPEPSQGDLSDTGTLDLLGKVGYEFGDQRLQFTTSYLIAEQDTDFISDPQVNAAPLGSVKAEAIEGLQLDEQTSRENLILNLGYSKEDLFGSEIQAQTYYRDYDTRFFAFDGRPFSGWNAVGQTFLESEVYGGRLSVDTPLTDIGPLDARLLWGADINHERTEQPATLFDGAAFDASGGTNFVVTDAERTFVPEVTTESYGVFGQLELYPADWLLLRGGVRQEWVSVSFSDFTTLGQGNQIQGGDISYSEPTFNAGVVVTPVDSIDLYTNFSQSFELPDIGLQLRFAPAGFNANDANLDPRITDHYEIGVRGTWSNLSANLAAFYSESDKGRVLIEDFSLVQDRSRERIYGVEAKADYRFNESVTVGGTFAWLEGERENPNGSGNIALNGFRIPPIKLTGYVEYTPYSWWALRLQALHSADRDEASDDGVGFGGQKVEDFTVVDLYSAFDLGYGTLKVGVENLLNNQYHTVSAQLLRNGQNTSRVAAHGATARVAYSFKW